MSTQLRYPKGYQFFDGNGNPLALGNLYYYIAGTTTPQNTYSDSAATIPNTNPIVLDGSGRLQVDVYLGSTADYKEILTISGVTVSPWPDDNIVRATSTGVFTGDSGSGGTSGLVPSPIAGDALANKFLKADGTWAVTPAGSGSGSTNLSVTETVTTVSIGSSTGSGATIPAATSSLAGALDSARAAKIDGLATVATSGSYTDLSNKPTIPAAQVNSDWNASSGLAQILNKPALATVATSGSYTDLSNEPTIPSASSTTPVMDGTGAAGSLSNYARADHVHPTDTSRVATSALGANNGVATLDSGGKLTSSQIPSSLVGAVVYQGTWNASTNTPALASGVGAKGNYYKVSAAGTTTIDGVSQWNVGDTIIFDGIAWDKIDGIASEVISVAGLYGVISSSALKSALTIGASDVSGLAAVATSGAYSSLSGTPALGSLAALSSVNNANWSGTALSISNGGTGQTTASAAYNALSPMTTAGDMEYYTSGTGAKRLGIGSTGQVLTVGGGGVPVWATPSGGSGGSPGGSNGQLQFNSSGAFGASATTTSANGELIFAGSNKYLQFQPWAPSTGPTPAPGFMGYVDYGYYGTSGTLSGITASTTSGSNNVTVNTATGLAVGNYISVAGVPYQFIINSISGTTVNVSPAPTATVSNAAVSYVAIDNPAMAYGYNVGHIIPSEPEWAKRHEADYLDVDGYRKCETYDEFKAVGVTGAGLRPYFAQVNRDIGNIEFVELCGGRNGVIFYGSDGYSTTQVNTGELFYKGGTTYFIAGTSSLLPGSYQANLRNATVVGSTSVNSAVVSNAGNLLHFGVKDNSGSPFADIYSQNISSGATPIPLYLQWGGGNIVFSSTAGAVEGQSSSLGSNPITGTQKFTFGGNAGNGKGNQLGWYTNSSFNGDLAHIRGDADAYGVNSLGAFVIAANSGGDATPGDRVRINGQGYITVYNGSGTPTTPTGAALMWANSGVFNFKDSSGNTCVLPAGGTLLSNTTSANLTAGYSATSYSLGTVAGGITTLSAANGNIQHMTNNGTFTLAPQSAPSTIALEIVNGTTAGAITTSGYTKVVGSFVSTSGSKFQCVSCVTNSSSALYITEVV